MSDPVMLHRAFGVHVKSVNEEERSVDVIASSEAIDSMDEIVTQDWDFASRFDGNPVVLYNHNRSDSFFGGLDPDDTLPIGYAKNYGVRNGKLEATLCFVDEKANPMAERCWQGFKQGSLRAVSVGFYSSDARAEKRDGKDIYRLSGNVLCEISAVPMGANPEAVARSADRLAQMKALVAEHEKRRAASLANPTGASAPEDTTMTNEEKAAHELTVKSLTDAAEVSKKTIEARDTEIAEARKSIETLTASVAKLTTDHAASETAKAEALASAKKAADDLTALEVKDLVGKKIYPAELDEMIDFAKSDRPRFDKQMKLRADIKVMEKGALGTEPATPAREGASPRSAVVINGVGEPTGGQGLGDLLASTSEDSAAASGF